MNKLVNSVKAFRLRFFDVCLFEAKIQVFQFDHQQINKFEFVGYSKNYVRASSMFDRMVFDPSLSATVGINSATYLG